jgi:cytoskeleton protein RodZ
VTQLSAEYLGIAGNANAGFSRDILQSIAGQIEAELYHSDAYRQAMNHLKALPEEAAKQMQTMLCSVSRAAIKLAMRQFVKQGKVVPLEGQPTLTEMSVPDPESAPVMATQEKQHQATVIPNPIPISEVQLSQAIPSQTAQPNKAANLLKYARKSKREELARLAAQEREDRLRQIGKTIQQAREAKSLSLRQLYSLTKVPVHQLEALELGRVDRLPEDIYVRGFIQRIGNTLGLDGVNLVATLPQPDQNRAVLPSWYQPPAKVMRVGQLNSLHLYVGYAALMAGGIAWLSQQSPPSGSLYPEIDIPSDSAAPSSQMTEPTYSKKLNSSKARMVSTPEIAPPEALRQ